jgi:hypothetical protein
MIGFLRGRRDTKRAQWGRVLKCVACGGGVNDKDWAVRDVDLIRQARDALIRLALDKGHFLHERCQKKLRLLIENKKRIN